MLKKTRFRVFGSFTRYEDELFGLNNKESTTAMTTNKQVQKLSKRGVYKFLCAVSFTEGLGYVVAAQNTVTKDFTFIEGAQSLDELRGLILRKAKKAFYVECLELCDELAAA